MNTKELYIRFRALLGLARPFWARVKAFAARVWNGIRRGLKRFSRWAAALFAAAAGFFRRLPAALQALLEKAKPLWARARTFAVRVFIGVRPGLKRFWNWIAALFAAVIGFFRHLPAAFKRVAERLKPKPREAKPPKTSPEAKIVVADAKRAMKSSRVAVVTSNPRRGLWFNKFLWGILYIFYGPLLCLFKHYRFRPVKLQSKTFLALGNHNTDSDMFFVALALRRHMRYVASANLLRGFSGSLIKLLENPIPRHKGAGADDTIQAVLECLKAGVNVCMFPEGVCSWNGETGFISRRTAALAKASGVGLVNYRLRGGYLSHPHWALKARRGPQWGEFVREYTPQELSGMTEDEVYAAICRDLYVDAFADQKARPVRYRGRRLAENLPSELYVCPACHAVGSLFARGDTLSCGCGYRVRYDEYGYFAGARKGFETVLSWDRWQREYLRQNRPADPQTPICQDKRLTLLKLHEDGSRTAVATDTDATFYCDRLTIGGYTFPLADIARVSPYRTKQVFFTAKDGYYELRAKNSIQGNKYFALTRLLSGREIL